MHLQRLLSSLLLTLFIPVAGAAELKVLTSITPVQLIASEVLAGVSQPEVLLPPGASPHQYSLRPSDVRKVKQADLIFWIGPELERFLEKTLSKTDATVLSFLEEEEGHQHEGEAAHEDEHESPHHDSDENLLESSQEHDEHDHGGIDPHLWLDPVHALEMAEIIRDAAIKVAPNKQALLEQNYAEFAAALLEKDQLIMSQLAPFSDRGFVVFHDAYSRFVKHYNLKQLGAVTINPSRKAGAKHLSELREAVIQSKAVCIFSEPQFSGSILKTIASGTSVRTAELDPLGQKIKPEKGAYLAFLTDFAQVFEECLQD
ncbi:zinc ABC transporter substrate-binding protein ZnuA [Neptunomonas japonica]|uniref:High-affinity zinc uptake system protein ZnuA n=1 Tax=Neptunomonas japonica JAMM 1380 TaxID=1441457 RepID=A0A7R6SU63_9GAMM|nr:zinc ABC transporter substrate-binding protein ZnuA [Neptunomonas japonica]BBB28015.1 zinc transport system substrate-binding protein [Neptunomonas japonica JAMM 1380]